MADAEDISLALEAAIQVSDEGFVQRYLKPDPSTWPTWTHPRLHKAYSLALISSADLTPDERRACFELVRLTSEQDYRQSSMGWHPRAKKKEMLEPELRYILVREGSAATGPPSAPPPSPAPPPRAAPHPNGDCGGESGGQGGDREGGAIRGFMSIMPTMENGEAVVYCYEIHLAPMLQGSGLGRQLMQWAIAAAENVPTRKTMLTCFRSNARAMDFYERLGFRADEFSPRARRLRGGRVVEPDYVIMSRRTDVVMSRRAGGAGRD